MTRHGQIAESSTYDPTQMRVGLTLRSKYNGKWSVVGYIKLRTSHEEFA